MRLIDKDELIRQLNENHIPYRRDVEKIIDGLTVYAPVINQYPEWIPVTERLPEERQPVYIRLRNGNVFRAEIRTRELLKEWWYCYGETDDMDMLGVVHEVKGWLKSNPVVEWQPLPEPYKPDNVRTEE